MATGDLFMVIKRTNGWFFRWKGRIEREHGGYIAKIVFPESKSGWGDDTYVYTISNKGVKRKLDRVLKRRAKRQRQFERYNADRERREALKEIIPIDGLNGF